MDFMKKIGKLSKKIEQTATDTYNVVADKSGKIITDTKTKISITRYRRRYLFHLC